MTTRVRIYNFGPGEVAVTQSGFPSYVLAPEVAFEGFVHLGTDFHVAEVIKTANNPSGLPESRPTLDEPLGAPPRTNEHVAAGCEAFRTPSNFQINDDVVLRGVVKGVHFEEGKVSYVVSLNPFGDGRHTYEVESDCVSAS